jgi:hypothetical protein
MKKRILFLSFVFILVGGFFIIGSVVSNPHCTSPPVSCSNNYQCPSTASNVQKTDCCRNSVGNCICKITFSGTCGDAVSGKYYGGQSSGGGSSCTTYSFPSFNKVSWSECNSSGIQNKTVVCPSGSGRCSGSCTIGTTNSIYQNCTYLEEPYFASLSEPNSPINSADLGDTILLRFGGENIYEDTNITFSVQIKNNTNWLNLLPFIPKRWGSFSVISGNPYQPYFVNNPENHRSNSSVQGEDIWKTSSELIINNLNNSIPIAVITHPEKATNEIDFFYTSVNCPIEFRQASYDHDDLLKLTWNFQDGTTNSVENYSLALNPIKADIIKNYSQGNKYYKIILGAEEMPTRTISRNPSITDQVEIFVFKQGINEVPIITSPERDSFQRHLVKHNASQSYIVNCSSSLPSYDFETCSGSLRCKYLLKPGSENLEPGVSGHVEVRWSDITNPEQIIYFLGNSTQGVVWNSANYNSSVILDKIYETPQQRRISLEIRYLPN